MQKGPRGRRRDRDPIIRLTLAAEQDWTGGVGVPAPDDATLTDKQVKAYRDAYCHAIRGYHAQGKMAGSRAMVSRVLHVRPPGVRNI